MKMIRAIILVLVAYSLSYAQQTPRASNITGQQVVGNAVATEFGKWSARVTTGNTASGSRTVAVDPSSFNVPDGTAIQPIDTTTPIRVTGDSNVETVTPSSVSCSSGSGICTFTATFAYAHPNTFQISSGTYGLQEAINFQKGRGGMVLVTPEWIGTTAMITGATGATNTSIWDMRTGSIAYYTWDGGGYVVTWGVSANGTIVPVTLGDISNLNGTRNATSFPGADIGAKVNAAHTDLPSTGGVIHIKGGAYSFSTAITLTKPVMIECDPRTTTVLTWTGAGVAITNHVGDAYPYMNSGIRGCTLKGTTAAAAWGVKQIDTIGALYEDVTFQDFTGASGGALWVDNQVTFSERGRFINCNFSNNTNGIKFKNTSGINSFMYWTMLGTHFQTEPGQVGIYAQGNGVLNGVYLGKWNAFIASFNLTDLFSHVGAAPVFFKLDNGAAFTQGAGISITGEQTTGSGGKVFNIDATAYVDGAGAIETAPLGSTIVTVNSLSIGPRLNSQDGGIYTNNLRAANLTGDRQATFPDGTGTVMLGNGTNSVIDTATTSSYLTLKNAGVSGWAFGMGTAFASHGEIFSYTDNQDVFDATAGGDTKLASKSGDVDLNAAGTKGVVMGTATGIRTAVNGNSDNAGAITLSGGTGTYAFTRTYTVAPICVASDITASNSARPGVTVTTLTITGTGSDVVNYVCFPRL